MNGYDSVTCKWQLDRGMNLVDEFKEELAMTTILVVDDLDDAASSMAMLLESRGHTCYTARNGTEALKQVRQHEPHIVLMDLSMPNMDGFATARHIRELPIQQPHLIALSGLDGSYIGAFTEVAGFDFYVRKPAATDEILSLVGELAGKKHAS